MNRVHLHGDLADRFGDHHDFHARNAAEIMRALCLQIDGFRETVEGGSYQVVRGDLLIGTEYLHLRMPQDMELHVIPVPAGEKSTGGKLIIGAVLIAASFALPGAGGVIVGGFAGPTGATAAATGIAGFAQGLGITMALSGAAQILSPTPRVSQGGYEARERPDERASFMLNGQVNTVEQGSTMPVIYGRQVRVGSKAGSAGLKIEATIPDSALITDGGFSSESIFRRYVTATGSVEWTTPAQHSPTSAVRPAKLWPALRFVGLNRREMFAGLAGILASSSKLQTVANSSFRVPESYARNVTPSEADFQAPDNAAPNLDSESMHAVSAGNPLYRAHEILQIVEFDDGGGNPMVQILIAGTNHPQNYWDHLVLREAADHDNVYYDLEPNDTNTDNDTTYFPVAGVNPTAQPTSPVPTLGTGWQMNNINVVGFPLSDIAGPGNPDFLVSALLYKDPRVTYDFPFIPDQFVVTGASYDSTTPANDIPNPAFIHGWHQEDSDQAAPALVVPNTPGVDRVFNELIYREGDRVETVVEMVAAGDADVVLALFLLPAARPQDWFDKLEFFNGSQLLATYQSSDAVYDATHTRVSGSDDVTAWFWENETPAFLRDFRGKRIRLKLTYADITVETPLV